MTLSALDPPPATLNVIRPLRPLFPIAWASSLLFLFFPRRIAKLWLTISLPQAFLIAFINTLFTPFWLLLLFVSGSAWENGDFLLHRDHPLAHFLHLLATGPSVLYTQWLGLTGLDRLAAILIPLFIFTLSFVILFFTLLPFTARPGASKPALRHLLRTLLLGTGYIHLWTPALSSVFFFLIVRSTFSGAGYGLAFLLFMLIALTVWTFTCFLIAVTRDYRTPADLPQPHDPWCEQCGYNLTGRDSELQGRCPECGKPVIDSIGPSTRPPTPWEQNPHLSNFRAINSQLAALITRPQDLFSSMPILTGQSAAHRWLFASIFSVGFLAAWILPVLGRFIDFDITFLDLFLRSLAIGLVWALLALMMVGIETAGVALFSRLRAQPGIGSGGGVPLASSAKVTAYSAILMLPWVILGGAQIISTIYLFFQRDFTTHVSQRNQQIILAASLAVAHIGGLLWYELTVYRGVRSIQYANK